MSIICKYFKHTQPYIERDLEEKYAQMIWLLPTGMTFKQIRQKVKEEIKLYKEETTKKGTGMLQDNYGEFLLHAAKLGDLEAKRIVDKARGEGATDDDIREFWNLTDLERRMIKFYENVFLIAQKRSLNRQNLSDDWKKEIEVEVRKISPVYGDPGDTSVSSGRDRPLPYELRARVERWKAKFIYKEGEERLNKKAYGYSSFNALVRDEIYKGYL